MPSVQMPSWIMRADAIERREQRQAPRQQRIPGPIIVPDIVERIKHGALQSLQRGFSVDRGTYHLDLQTIKTDIAWRCTAGRMGTREPIRWADENEIFLFVVSRHPFGGEILQQHQSGVPAADIINSCSTEIERETAQALLADWRKSQ